MKAKYILIWEINDLKIEEISVNDFQLFDDKEEMVAKANGILNDKNCTILLAASIDKEFKFEQSWVAKEV